MASIRSPTTNSRSKYSLWLIAPLLLGEVLLCGAIIFKIPYTEIDWKAYMEQVSQYLAGERDYAAIKGGTGPLVYPAAHVYLYSALHYLTSAGRNIALAQWLFAIFYVITLTLVTLCYREAQAPAYLLPLLCMSKRLHSIYVLRLFNDPLAVMLLWSAVLCWQRKNWSTGSVAFSLAVGVKMSALLVLPAVGVMYLLALGRNQALAEAGIIILVQAVLAGPFITRYPWSYLAQAFEFTRKFLFRWTVNWRFVGEELFTSREFALGLLGMHFALLVVFGLARWKLPAQRTLLGFVGLLVAPATSLDQQDIAARVTPRFILTTVLTANTIGMLCARSLHYQFFAWLAWGTPFLLWQSGLGPVWTVLLWASQEWAWNVFPSTRASSLTVVGVLALTTCGVFLGTRTKSEETKKKRKNA